MSELAMLHATLRAEIAQLHSAAGLEVNVASGEMLQAARNFLGVMGEDGGWATGGFTTRLIETMMAADGVNRALLGSVYPELLVAVVLYKDAVDGRALLIQLATRGNPVAMDRL